ncbi:hypothetical protein RD792_004237 [Penstemon davidsonii]|uniref:Cation efflux protein transmembrane domain-containing protein n=1 Tax=Penstemon davidsonii TaxID=160366 RepID=A0ABR0DI15_9LAMI|nr:hypothetical protein RD792_004237 [Penstemon davidsonii]
MYCGTAAMILAELSGNLAARFIVEGNKDRNFITRNAIGSSKVRGFIALFSGFLLLSISWDRIECFPLSHVNVSSRGFLFFPSGNCLRIWPMLLPFLSGFLGCYERVLSNWGEIRELGQKRVRLITLFFTTATLFIPAIVSMLVFEVEGDSISVSSLSWPLANTVVFGVLLSENFTEEKVAGSKDFQREYFVTFLCTLVLELFYFSELSLWGLLICGLLLWISVRELDPNYPELGVESSESFTTTVMKPIRHILSERKSRKIAMFLLINTAYMVVEFVAGFMSNSLGLISDACHMLFDCAALAIGLYASYISRLPANGQFNYGRGRFEVLSGYVNAVFLVLVGALITLESFERILDPQEISTSSLLTVSIGGLVVNMVGLVFFHEEHHHAHGGSGSCSHSHAHSEPHLHSHSEAHTHSHSGAHTHAHSEAHTHAHSEAHTHAHSEAHTHAHSEAHTHAHSGSHLEAHSHSHLHPHHHHDHHLQEQDSKIEDEHQECITVVHDGNEKSGLNHKNEHSGGHEHGKCNHHHHHEHHHHDHVDHRHKHGETDSLLERKEKKTHQHHIDHNMQGIFLHVLADTLGSVGVVISTLLIKYKGWLVADPACSIFISLLIVSSVIPLLRNSAEILLQRVPRSCEHDLKEAISDVTKLKGVFGIQNLHVWSFTNSDVVGTIHLHVSPDADKTCVKKQASEILRDSGIKDLTVQIECVNCTQGR